MEKEIDKIISWAETWKMSLNTDKTKAMIISSNPADSKINLGLRAVTMILNRSISTGSLEGHSRAP